MRYFVKKFFSMAATLFLVSFLVFAAFEVIPGDVAVSMLGTNATESTVAALREELGLNRPFLTRFFDTRQKQIQSAECGGKGSRNDRIFPERRQPQQNTIGIRHVE